MTERACLLLHETFEQWVDSRPDAIAVVQGGSSLSFAALDSLANRWARRLRAAGIGPECTVGVHLERTPELVAVLLGVLKAGGVYVPLDRDYPRERLELVAAGAGVRVVVSETPDLGLRTAAPVEVLVPACDQAADPVRRRPSPRLSVDNLAYVLHTSGSSGRPKGAALTHANGVDLVRRVRLAFGPDLDRVLAATSICFDCSVLEIFGTLGHGGTVVLAESAMDIGSGHDGRGVSLVHTVPSVVNELLRTDRLPPSVRTAIVGGERLDGGVADRIHRLSSIVRLVNIYGPVECATYVTLATIARDATGQPPIGFPEPGVRIHLVNPVGAAVPSGHSAEIFVASAGVARGYLHEPAESAERFLPDPFAGRPGGRWYRTGDLAHRDANGELHFDGRVDDQIKIRGVRVEPVEVERALLAHPDVLEVVVTAGSGRLIAHLAAAVPVVVADLRSFAADRLPRPLCPDGYVVVERLPRLPNGKVDRLALGGTPACGSAEPRDPATGMETRLRQLWAEALDNAALGVDDDVMDRGGHSLLVFGVRARLGRALGASLPLQLFFQETTVAGQAGRVAELLASGSSAPTSAGVGPVTSGPVPLSANQREVMSRVRGDAADIGLVLPLAVRLAGPAAPHALSGSWSELLRRHDSLRTRIVSVGNEDAQEPMPHVPVRIGLVDLSGIADGRAQRIVDELVRSLTSRAFDLGSGPPARTALLRRHADEHAFLVAVHAVVADAWSMETLGHQMVGLYSAAIHGRPPTRVPLPAQYTDRSAEQRHWLGSPDASEQLRYWRSRLVDLPTLAPPPGRARAAGPARPVVRSFHIGAELTARLAETARVTRATRFMVLLAAFAVLLLRRSGQEEIVVGCPVAGRDRPDLTTVIGPCHNALVLRIDLSGRPSFTELVGRVREVAIDAYAHGDIEFRTLVDRRESDTGAHPVFQAGIGFQQRPSLLNYPYSRELMGRDPIGPVTLSGIDAVTLPPTALDIELAVAVDVDDELEGVLTCRSDIVRDDEVDGLADWYHAILDRATARPALGIDELASGSR